MEPGPPTSSQGGYRDERFPVGTDAPVGGSEVIAQRARVGQDWRTGPERNLGAAFLREAGAKGWRHSDKGAQRRR